MIEFLSLHHVSLAVRDLEQARHFYTEILGFQEMQRPPVTSKGVWYSIGTQQLHLIENPPGKILRGSGENTVDGHFAISVSSYKQTIEFLESASIKYDANPNSVVGFSQIYIVDLDYNTIEFASPYGS